MYLHGMSFLPLSRQQKHDTPQAITTMRITETHPTIKSSFKLIWQFLPANQARHSQLTCESWLITHSPFLLHKSHSVVVAAMGKRGLKLMVLSKGHVAHITELHFMEEEEEINNTKPIKYLWWFRIVFYTYLSKLCQVKNQALRSHGIHPCIDICNFLWHLNNPPIVVWKYVCKLNKFVCLDIQIFCWAFFFMGVW